MSCFGELPDVVLSKIAQKRQKLEPNSEDLMIFVKSTSGSTEIHNFYFFVFLRNFWPKMAQKRQKTEAVDFGATRCGFHKNCALIFGVFEQFLAKPH